MRARDPVAALNMAGSVGLSPGANYEFELGLKAAGALKVPEAIINLAPRRRFFLVTKIGHYCTVRPERLLHHFQGTVLISRCLREGNRRSRRPVKGTASRRAALALDWPARRFWDGYKRMG
jgi:hypothetical protein